jgi:hypothetical protein
MHLKFDEFCKREYVKIMHRFYSYEQWDKKLILTFLYEAARKEVLQC